MISIAVAAAAAAAELKGAAGPDLSLSALIAARRARGSLSAMSTRLEVRVLYHDKTQKTIFIVPMKVVAQCAESVAAALNVPVSRLRGFVLMAASLERCAGGTFRGRPH